MIASNGMLLRIDPIEQQKDGTELQYETMETQFWAKFIFNRSVDLVVSASGSEISTWQQDIHTR